MVIFSFREERRIDGGHNLGYKKDVVAIVKHNLHHIVSLTRYPNDPYNSRYDLHKSQVLTNQYLQNDGKYICYHGVHQDPFIFLDFVADHGYKFTMVESTFHDTFSDSITIGGNLDKLSCAFRYRFFDKVSFVEWLAIAKSLDPDLKV